MHYLGTKMTFEHMFPTGMKGGHLHSKKVNRWKNMDLILSVDGKTDIKAMN